MPVKTIFEQSAAGRRGYEFSRTELETPEYPQNLLRKEAAELPEVTELDVVRHYTRLSAKNYSVDAQFYPLGSCTMKYNPRSLERIASIPGFTRLHPMLSALPGGDGLIQGALEVMHELSASIAEITGMDAVTPLPMAGAHGEMTGILIVEAYHRSKGNKKTHVIVPDTSHGTNPASAAMSGYDIVTIPTLPNGETDFEALKAAINSETAAVMMTCPNTLGLFETRILEITRLAHSVDALMYYDGANLNAVMGRMRPGDAGFDVVHVNVHKTFGTPHGGGGPGAGPVGVKAALVPFLPGPLTVKENGKYALKQAGDLSIGRVSGMFGNFGVLLKAYAYIRQMGANGLKLVSEMAVLNANYIRARLTPYLKLPYDRICMHECVFSGAELPNGIHTLDIAKGLIDRGYHPPTVYFPLVVKEALMIEPTETESKETIDQFIDTMIEVIGLASTDPESLRQAPVTTPVGRLDETRAAREVRVCLG